jgi:hypothetical protein
VTDHGLIEEIKMWTKVFINFLLVFWAYLFAIILAIAILTLWAKSKKRDGKRTSAEIDPRY